MSTASLQQHFKKASRVLKAMSNPHRLHILCELQGEECSVGELVRRVGLSQSALSQHLARLRRDELVTTRREAQTIYYSLASGEIRAILQTLQKIYTEQAARGGESPARSKPSRVAARG
jgi:DNA-binding transcriptional ArsR family regulator